MVEDGAIYTIDTDWEAYKSDIYAVQAIPEPATLALSVLVAVGMIGARRFRL